MTAGKIFTCRVFKPRRMHFFRVWLSTEDTLSYFGRCFLPHPRLVLGSKRTNCSPNQLSVLEYSWTKTLLLLFIINGSTALLLGLGRSSSFLILYSASRTPWTGISPSQGLYLHTRKRKQNKRTQTSTLRVRSKPTTAALKRAKTVHVLNGKANGHYY
jgi:hypothetical protein